MKPATVLAALLLLIACAPATPPASLAPRVPTVVDAPPSRVWDAVIDEFAAANIPIRTMERASGFIATDNLMIADRQAASAWAKCRTAWGFSLPPDRATYNVVVRGDSARSTVLATVRFTQGGTQGDPVLIECASQGAWESGFEGIVKRRAESSL